jgi:hypothetical protein
MIHWPVLTVLLIFFTIIGCKCLTQLQQYPSYIVAASFDGEGSQSTEGKPPTCS